MIAHLPTFRKPASQKLRDHFEGINNESGKKYHLEAVQQAEAFKRVMEIKQIAIDQHSGGASNWEERGLSQYRISGSRGLGGTAPQKLWAILV